MVIVSLESLIADMTGKTVKRRSSLRMNEPALAVDETGLYAVVNSEANLTCRGVFDRWVPARSEGYGGWVELKARFKAAWGVITGRYDVLDWSLADDPQGAKK